MHRSNGSIRQKVNTGAGRIIVEKIVRQGRVEDKRSRGRHCGPYRDTEEDFTDLAVVGIYNV